MTIEHLISPSYLDEQIRLHAQPNGYGGRGKKWATHVAAIGHCYGYPSVLDYGCGQGSLAFTLRMASHFTDIREYDPAIEGKNTLPEAADLVVCTDVLEHVEPERIWTVLQHLSRLARKACFVVISLVETAKTLSDGRQAHILLRPVDWWKAQADAHGFIVAREFAIKPEKQWCALWMKPGHERMASDPMGLRFDL